MNTIAQSIHLRACQAYEIGKADTLHGIRTFPPQGTDRAKTIQEWKALILAASETCQDKSYAEGVRAALDTIN